MKGFIKTVAVVTVFSICEKFLGFLYRIFLSRTIGAEGIGLYQVALSVFALLLTVCSSGTPITVSRLMTKYKAEGREDKVKKVITAGLAVTFFTALPICIIFFVFRNSLSFIFADPRCKSIFLVALPGLLFTSIYSVFRGVFWGNKDFLPYSIIELLEEACMIIAGIMLISTATTVYDGAYKASVAVLISYIFSFLLASLVFFIRKNKLSNPKSQLKPLLSSAMPITAMRTANSFIVSLVSIILPMRLISAGFSPVRAMSVFGSALGEAIPILYIPTTLIGSFTLVLVPEISEDYYTKNTLKFKLDAQKAIKTTTIVACLCIPVFISLGKEIGVLFYNNPESGKFLSVSSYLMLFMSLSSITTSVLNSIGLETKTLIFYIIGAVLMLACIWVLPSLLGIYSLVVGFLCVFGLTTLFNLILLSKKSPVKIEYKKHLVCCSMLTIPAIIFGFMLKNLLINLLGTFFTTLITGFITLAFSLGLYLVFNLIKIDMITSKLKMKRKPKIKKSATL